MKIKLIAIFCIILIISLPIVYSAANSEGTASERAGADPLYGGSLGGYAYTQDPYAEQLRKSSGGYSSGLDQYLGEAIITYVADYQPRQLRESELEQADRPVYVFLKGTHTGQLLSPFTNDPSAKDPLSGLTSIPPIDRIEVYENKTSDYSKYIRFVNYIPPRADRPSLNNLGTVIVMVRKLPTANETIKDNTITLDMNARIFLKLQESNLLGISQQDLVLKQIPDRDDFIKNKDEYSFFTGKGYIQATKISSDSVTLQVFNRDLYPISLYNPTSSPAAAGLQPGAVITLTKCQTSPPLSFRYSGNPLSDMFQIRLEEVSTPTDKAEIEFQLDGRTTTRKIGVGRELYAGSKWILRSATTEEKTNKENFNKNLPQIAKEFKLNVQAQNQITKKIADGINFIVKNHIVVLENKFTGETKEITREIISEETGSQLAVDITPISPDMADLIENSYCDENKNVPPDDYACTAIKKYKELIEKYPTSPEVAKAKKDLAEIYDSASIEFKPCLEIQTYDAVAKYQGAPMYQKALDECYQFQQDMLELAFYYYSQIGEQSKIKNKYGGKGGDDFLEDEGIPLKLLKIITKDEEKGTASLRIYEETGKYSEKPHHEKDILDFGVNYKGNQNYRWRIDSLYPTSLTLRLYEVPQNDKSCKDCKATSEQITLKLNEQKDIPIEYSETDIAGQPKQLQKTKALMVTQIESKNEAYITILPGAGRGFVTSSFRIHIPVDPRPFKWTPEQLESQIKSTKEIIKKLDDIITKIDKFVTSMKKICLGVFAFLTIKNSFTGVRNLARRQVSEAYKQRCQTEVAEKKTEKHEDFRRLEICLGHYSSEMSSAIDASEKHMREINSKIEGKTADEIKNDIASTEEQKLCGEYEKFAIASKTLGTRNQDTIKKYRDCLLNAKVQLDDSLNTQVKESFSKKFDEINTKKTTDLYDQAWNIARDSNDKWDEHNSTHIQKIINQIEFDRQREEEQVESKTVQIQLTNAEAGKWAGEALLQDSNKKYQSTTLKGLSKYEFIVYENELTSQEKVNEHICKKELNGDWEINKCKVNKREINQKEFDQKIKELKDNPAQEGTNQKFVSQEFYTQTYNQQGFLTLATPKPIYYYSSSISDTAGRQISTEYSGLQLTAYYDKDGLPYCYPVGKGNYVYVLERFPGPSQEIKFFKVMNVGSNGRIECNSGDDENVYLPEELNIKIQEKKNFLNKEPKVKCKDPGKTQVGSVDNKPVICQAGDQAFGLGNLVKPQCTDVMDPTDCKIMFNFCDPVMCPSSRCTLGGRVPERNVIQSGVIGSTVLCLPNIKQGIVMPVCLTGISAGLKGIKSILEGYQFCLETNLKEGKNVGLCDYIRSVGICEVVWKEAYNLLDIGGKGIIDWVTGAIETKGGGEYLQFQTSLQNVGDSVRTFTEEYKTTYTAQFLSQTTEEIGSQICRLSVNGKLPSVGKILDQLTEPENPPQFTAFFDISPYASPGETPPTSTIPGGTQEISRYKIFYHIYAGTGFYQGSYSQPVSLFNPQTQFGPPQAITYSVYLINKELGLPPLYVTFPDENIFQQPGRLDQNKFVQQTVQKLGAKGYNQVCVNINGIENCGFQRVSSSFGLREMQDALTGDEASKKIDSEQKCVPSSKSSPEYSVAKLGAVAGFQLAAGATGTGIFQPQSGAVGTGIATSGIEEGLFSTGIVRLCAIETPTTETGRWKEVGTCGKDERDKTLGKCWLDLKSVSIEDRKFNEEFLRELRERADPNLQLVEAEKAKGILFGLNKERNTLLDAIRAAVAAAKKGEAPEVTRTIRARSVAPTGESFTTSKEKEKNLSPYIKEIAGSLFLESNVNTYFFLKSIIKIENSWKTKPISCAGAAGLVQLMPHTAKSMGLKVLDPVQDLTTVEDVPFCKGNGCQDNAAKEKRSCKNKHGEPDPNSYNSYANALRDFVESKEIAELASLDERFDDKKAVESLSKYFETSKKELEKAGLQITVENLAATYQAGYGIIKDIKSNSGNIPTDKNAYSYAQKARKEYDKLVQSAE